MLYWSSTYLFIYLYICLFIFCVGKDRGAGLSVLVELRKASEVMYYLTFNGQMGQCCLIQYISFPSEEEKSYSEHLVGTLLWPQQKNWILMMYIYIYIYIFLFLSPLGVWFLASFKINIQVCIPVYFSPSSDTHFLQIVM